VSSYEGMSNEELRRVIAERLGWTFSEHEWVYSEDIAPTQVSPTRRLQEWKDTVKLWVVARPDDTIAGWVELTDITPQLQQAAIEFAGVPNWPEDLNEALDLFPPGVLVITLTRFGTGNWAVDIPSMGYPHPDLFTMSKSPTAARSVALAFLAWSDAQEGNGG
jgi:hypothetical protein